MTKLEQAILSSARSAEKAYSKMTGGHRLHHGPERFLQAFVAFKMAEKGWPVYMDVSLKRIQADFDKVPGRPRGDRGRRPDICIWRKSASTNVGAIIEVKFAWSFAPIAKDAAKVTKFLTGKRVPSRGYLLAYSTATRSNLHVTFKNWASRLSWTMVGSHVQAETYPNDWSWGVCLLRAPT